MLSASRYSMPQLYAASCFATSGRRRLGGPPGGTAAGARLHERACVVDLTLQAQAALLLR